MTDAKRELIKLGRDSPTQFIKAFEAGDVAGFPAAGAPKLLTPCLSTDMFELYQLWCRNVGLKSLNMPRFLNEIERKHKARTERKRYDTIAGTKGPSSVVFMPAGHELPAGEGEKDWLGDRIEVFKTALADFRGSVR